MTLGIYFQVKDTLPRERIIVEALELNGSSVDWVQQSCCPVVYGKGKAFLAGVCSCDIPEKITKITIRYRSLDRPRDEMPTAIRVTRIVDEASPEEGGDIVLWSATV